MKLLPFLFYFGFFLSLAQGSEFNWVGKGGNGEEVALIAKPIPGQQNFYALLKTKARVELFYMEKFDEGEYTLSALGVDSEGILAFDDSPLWELLITNGKNNTVAKLVSADGSKGHAVFRKKASRYSWGEITQGTYAQGNQESALNIVHYDPQDFQGTATFSARQLSGTFYVYETRPGIYQFHSRKLSSTGSETDKLPRGIGIFLEHKKKSFWSRKKTEVHLVFIGQTEQILFVKGSPRRQKQKRNHHFYDDSNRP